MRYIGLLLLMFTNLMVVSCGADDPCKDVQCSGQNVSGGACVAGACQGSCTTGYADCNGNLQADGCEASLQDDPKRCGACTKSCSSNHIATPTCAGGLCDGVCDSGWADCNKDKLTDGCETKSDDSVSNCGGCGKACSTNHIAAPACAAGVCTGACDTGFLDCNKDKLDDGCETDPSKDILNCGGCGKACSASHVTPTCAAGVCSGACDLGFADCNNNKLLDGCEVATLGDANNCGACGAKCSVNNIATPTCTMGACSGACTTGFADCNSNKLTDGCEVNIASDASNCGGCGTKCSANNVTPMCTAGVCSGACAAGYADCNSNKLTDGCEINTTTDAQNCGGCGTKCSANHVTPTCAAGVCSGACAAGYADCNSNKLTDGCEISTATDAQNCGGCGTRCSANNVTPTCAAGVCSGACAAGYADCNSNKLTDGCEINTTNDALNCGGCAAKCSSNHVTPACAAGVCNGACAAGYADCNSNKLTDGCEVTLSSDSQNCGACGNKCAAGDMCKSSKCVRAQTLLGSVGGFDWYKVQVTGTMTDPNIAAACAAAGLRVPCSMGAPGACVYNAAGQSCVTNTLETSCGNPMMYLSFGLCGAGVYPHACSALYGVFQFMGNAWSGACGAAAGSWCVSGSGTSNQYALCIQ